MIMLWVFRVFKYHRMQINNAANINIVNQSNHMGQVDLLWFVRILFIGFGVSANLFFWFLFIMSSYCYLAYKGQSNVTFLLPAADDSLTFAFEALLTYCFFAKLLYILMLIW